MTLDSNRPDCVSLWNRIDSCCSLTTRLPRNLRSMLRLTRPKCSAYIQVVSTFCRMNTSAIARLIHSSLIVCCSG